MKPIKSFIIKASIAALSLSTLTAYAATSRNSEFVKNVDIDYPGSAAVIHIKNTAANKHVNAVDLKVQESNLNFLIHGLVECKSGNAVKFFGAHAYFGPVGIGGLGGLSTSATRHTDTIEVGYDDGGSVEYTEDTFTVPLNKLQNGHPATRVDPLEEINKKLQAHLQGGGTKVDFYKHDQEIVLQRPLSLAGVCGNKHKVGDNSVGFETKNHTIQIKYEGDPAINDTPVINAQLLNGNMPNQINNDLPIHLDKAEFQPNIPNYVGKCLPDDNQKIQINLQFSGNGAGYLDLKVVPVSNTYADYGTYYSFNSLPVNAQATKKLDFSFPLKTMLQQEKYSYMAIANNKTWNHNMKIQGRFKSKEDDSQWSQWKDMDTAIFKHRCVPQLNGQLGNQGGIQGYDNGNAGSVIKSTIKANPVTPIPKPLNKAAPLPTPTPKPMSINAPTPSPTPLTIKQSEPEPTPVLRLKTN